MLFDIRIFDMGIKSYSRHSLKDVLAMAEHEKKRKHACEECRAMFTLLSISVNGMIGKEANHSSYAKVG